MDPLTPTFQTGFLDENRPQPESTPFKGSTNADDENQTRVRARLGRYNNDEMFVDKAEPFLGHYLDHVNITDEEIDQCIAAMASERDPKRVIENGVWVAYDGRAPSFYESTENPAFVPFGKIIDQIVKHNPRSVDAAKRLRFRLCPDNWIMSDIEGGKFKIDACFMEISQRKGIKTRHVYLPIEIKLWRQVGLRMQVHNQILGACHHILNEDPRRMWAYGLTFENDLMSIWYFSRSHSVKTYVVNWIKNPRLFIKVILTFYNAGHQALGIDPTVHLGPLSEDGKTLSYVYELPPHIKNPNGPGPIFYKTGQIRSPARPMCFAGRVTRVWEVTQVTAADGMTEVNPGKKVILKDVWLDEGAPTEAANMDQIFQDVDAFVSTGLERQIREELKKRPGTPREAIESDPHIMLKFVENDSLFKRFDKSAQARLAHHFTKQNYRSMFLTKLYDWKGEVSKTVNSKTARRCDNIFPTEDVPDYNNKEPAAANVTRMSVARSQVPKAQSGYRETVKAAARSSRRFIRKQQFRVVYEEVCHSLYEIDTLGEVVDILCQAIDAAHILFAAGWVHRDLSAGNILAIKTGPNETWSVKIADFEFSRKMRDPQRMASSDPRTGTPFFMPTEILSRQHLYEDLIFMPATSLPFRISRRTAAALPTLAAQFQLTENDPAYSAFDILKPVLFLPSPTAFPEDADPSKLPAIDASVNHNFQHDLESIWWILFWFVTMNVKWSDSYIWAHKYFSHDVEQFDARARLFNKNLMGPNSTSKYLRDELLLSFPDLLEDLRSDMNNEYVKREIYGQLELPESYSDIHATFSDLFRQLAQEEGSWRELKIGCGIEPDRVKLDAPAEAGLKRSHNEVGDKLTEDNPEDGDGDVPHPQEPRKKPRVN